MARHRNRRFTRLADRIDLGSGPVTVNGVIVSNPNTLVSPDDVVAYLKNQPLRGTLKLRAALARFTVPVENRVCLDVGAAAGGFTAELLDLGARRVYAVDVGFGQLAGRLRQDPRAVNLERTNLAQLSTKLVPDPIDVFCLDLSYLPLVEALPQVQRVQRGPAADLVALVKPAFELRSGSMVEDNEAIDKAVHAAQEAARLCGWQVDSMTVPVVGGGGAREVFIHGMGPP